MGKIRIILADTDDHYVHSLQIRFAEEFSDRIDLEIITDIDCYAELLETPQHAEILVVEERLYDPSLNRHSFENIYVLQSGEPEKSEERLQAGSGNSSSSKITRIYKYSSIPEIFSEIVGKSGLTVPAAGSESPQLILVTSASGGVGKTTIAMGLCIGLSRSYKKVLYIGAQHLQTFSCLLDHPDPIEDPEVYAAMSAEKGNIYSLIKGYIRREDFSYLPPFKSSLISLGLPFSLYLEVADAARKSGEYDFVVVDTESVLNEEHMKLLEAADRILVVVKQSVCAAAAAGLYVRNIGRTATERYLFVCNEFRRDAYNALNCPEHPPLFAVDEYIPAFDGQETVSSRRMAQDESIRRIACRLI